MQLNRGIGEISRVRDKAELEGSIYLSSDLREEFGRSYNRRSFGFSHGLGDHAVFPLPNLASLASRLEANGRNYCPSGKIKVSDGWWNGTQAGTSLFDILSGIKSNDSLVMLKGAKNDRLVGPVLKNDLIAARATMLIASPNRITAYHADADADVNFLMQVPWDKLFNVFDRTDRSPVTEDEVERFPIGEECAISFKPERQQDAISCNLDAGDGRVGCSELQLRSRLDQASCSCSQGLSSAQTYRPSSLFSGEP